MFSLKNVTCDMLNFSLKFHSLDDGYIKFEDNTIYFIMGESGIGKSTLLNFFSDPFSESPVKNGEIIFNHSGLLAKPGWFHRNPCKMLCVLLAFKETPGFNHEVQHSLDRDRWVCQGVNKNGKTL